MVSCRIRFETDHPSVGLIDLRKDVAIAHPGIETLRSLRSQGPQASNSGGFYTDCLDARIPRSCQGFKYWLNYLFARSSSISRCIIISTSNLSGATSRAKVIFDSSLIGNVVWRNSIGKEPAVENEPKEPALLKFLRLFSQSSPRCIVHHLSSLFHASPNNGREK